MTITLTNGGLLLEWYTEPESCWAEAVIIYIVAHWWLWLSVAI